MKSGEKFAIEKRPWVSSLLSYSQLVFYERPNMFHMIKWHYCLYVRKSAFSCYVGFMGQGIVMNELIQPIAANWNHVICWDVSNIHRCELLICSEQTLIFSDFFSPNSSLQLIRTRGRKEKNRSFTKIFLVLDRFSPFKISIVSNIH